MNDTMHQRETVGDYFLLLNVKVLLDGLFSEYLVDNVLGEVFFFETGLLVGLGIVEKLVLDFDPLVQLVARLTYRRVSTLIQRPLYHSDNNIHH